MASNWQSIVSGDTGLEVSDKFDSAFQGVDIDLVQIATNTANIATNASDITTVEGEAAANTATNVTQDGRLDALEGGGGVDKTIYNDVTGNEPAATPGQVYYADDTLNFNTAYGTTLQIGQEQYLPPCINQTGVEVPSGTPVAFTGLSSGYISIHPANALTFDDARVLGVTTTTFAIGGTGLVTTYGIVHDIDTSGIIAGQIAYLAESGGFTNTPPDIASSIGMVTVTDTVAGSIIVKINNLINLPQILAFMGSGTGPATISTTYVDIANYATSGNVVMDFNATDGTISIPEDGLYTISINMTIEYDQLGNAEEDLTLRISASTSGDVDIPLKLPRNGTGTSFGPTSSAYFVAGDVVKLQLASPDGQTGVVYRFMNFQIESKHVR